MLSSDVEQGTPLTLEANIFGLGTYFFPINSLSEKKSDVPQNEDSTWIKSKMLHISFY